jgi:hypothetical protein
MLCLAWDKRTFCWSVVGFAAAAWFELHWTARLRTVMTILRPVQKQTGVPIASAYLCLQQVRSFSDLDIAMALGWSTDRGQGQLNDGQARS